MDVTSLWLIIMMSSLAFTKPAEGLPKGRPTFNCAMISGTYFPNYCFMKDGLHVKWTGRGKGSQYVIAWVRNRLWVTLSVNEGGGEGRGKRDKFTRWISEAGKKILAEDSSRFRIITSIVCWLKIITKGGGEGSGQGEPMSSPILPTTPIAILSVTAVLSSFEASTNVSYDLVFCLVRFFSVDNFIFTFLCEK